MGVLSRKSPFPLDLSVEHKGKLSASTVTTVATELLQYLVYQRQQLPLPVPAVLQAVARGDTCASCPLEDIFGFDEECVTGSQSKAESNLSSSTKVDASALIRNNLLNARAKQAWMRQQRLWQRYFNKAQKFTTLYQKIFKALENQLQSGAEVEGVRFALGCSSITAREVYTLHFPATAAQSPVAVPLLPQASRPIMLALMRSLMSSEELLTLVNTKSGLKKIWILVLKPEDGIPSQPENGLEWIPRIQYTVAKGAKSVDIKVKVQEEPTSAQVTPKSDAFRTPSKTVQRAGRRILPSLAPPVHPPAAQRTHIKFAHEETALSHDSLADDMEQFELSPLEFSDNATPSVDSSDTSFLKPLAPPVKSVRKSRASFKSSSAVNEYSADTPKRAANYEVLDMVETPVVSIASHTKSDKEFRKCDSSCGLPGNWGVKSHIMKTPIRPIRSYPGTCTKVLDMEETPVQPTRSLPGTCTKVLDMVETPVQPTRSLPGTCTKVLDMVETPVQPTRSLPGTCTKVLDMVETPVQPTRSLPGTCTKVFNMIETPDQPTRSFPGTCTKVLDMEETPVQPTHSLPGTCKKVFNVVETPIRPIRSLPGTCTKILDMEETPVQPTRSLPGTCTKVLDMEVTPVQPTRSLPGTCTKILDMEETPVQPTRSLPGTCTKVLDMEETPVQPTRSLPGTCTKVIDMVETPLQPTRSLPTFAKNFNMFETSFKTPKTADPVKGGTPLQGSEFCDELEISTNFSGNFPASEMLQKEVSPVGSFLSDNSISSERKRQCLETSRDHSFSGCISEEDFSEPRCGYDSLFELSSVSSSAAHQGETSTSMDSTGADYFGLGAKEMEAITPGEPDCDNIVRSVDRVCDSTSVAASEDERSERILSHVAAQQTGPLDIERLSAETKCERKLIWYELSMPLVGFLDKPVSKPVPLP